MKTRITESELFKLGFVKDENNATFYSCKRVWITYGNYGEDSGEQKGAMLIIPFIYEKYNINIAQSYSKELLFIEEIEELYFMLHGEKIK